MKKIFLAISLLAASAGVVSANDEFNDGLLENMDIKTFISTLNNIEGYFFVGSGEDRDISLTLSRPDGSGEQEDFVAMSWKSMNTTIARMSRGDNNVPILTGGAYGETIITALENNPDGTTEKHNFVVFVCPKITIVSPEGAIYSYHKVFNQNTRIQFTQSDLYSVNSVLRIDGAHPEGLDITDEIQDDGWYESKEQITDDTIFWVAMESNDKEGESDTATGNSDIKIFVKGSNVTIDGDNENILNGTFTVTDLWNRVLYSGSWPKDNNGTRTLTFNSSNKGVFFLTSAVNNKTYKIIIHSFES